MTALPAGGRPRVVFGLFLGVSVVAWTHAQVTWRAVSPGSRPADRRGHAMAYDLKAGRVVLFGGLGPKYTRHGDTWEFDGSTWRRLSTGGPSARWQHAMAYDAQRDETVLFGGTTETWVWRGRRWTRRSPKTSPPPLFDTAMAYDLYRQRAVLFGGHTAKKGRVIDTWEWDGKSWTKHPPALRPPGRVGHAMAYDAARRRVVLFGGTDAAGKPLRDTWEWDGKSWTKRSPPVSPPGGLGHAMAYDAARRRVVLFGGNRIVRPLNETWEFDGTTWRQRRASFVPPPRDDSAMVYDWNRRLIILFGGSKGPVNGWAPLGDTWEYRTVSPASYRNIGSGCAGSSGKPSLAPAIWHLPWIADTFKVELGNLPPGRAASLLLGSSKTRWGTYNLPLPLGFLGMPGCNLYVSPDLVLPITNNGGKATWAVGIPNNPWLARRSFYNQGLVLDPGANSLGVVVSNGGQATIGVR